MIDQCLPTDGALRDDWVLWVELWLRSARDPALRPTAARLYARLHAWFAEAIAEGTAAGELGKCDAGRVADRALALIDGYGIRVLAGDPDMPLERARGDLGGPGHRAGRYLRAHASSARRSASVRDRGSPFSPVTSSRAPALTTSAPSARLDRLARAHARRPQPVHRAAHHDLGVAARGHPAEVRGQRAGDLRRGSWTQRHEAGLEPGVAQASPR